MSKAANGQQMQLQEALKLLDVDGEPIKWQKAEDGSYSGVKEKKGTKVKDAEGKDKELPGATYIYSITPQTTIVDVGVVEQVEGAITEGPQPEAKVEKATAKEEADNPAKGKQKKF